MYFGIYDYILLIPIHYLVFIIEWIILKVNVPMMKYKYKTKYQFIGIGT